ncbi:hypothetical protein JYU22_00910 [Gammaproteobacteria bacterium AH-315-E17]|nr:hypothetical protein [Gammaproteobacteria bacterium AH-315-E17]
MNRSFYLLFICMSLFGLSACSTQTIKSTTITEALIEQSNIPEDELLDIGIAVFNPGFDDIDEDQQELTFGDVRMAETYYTANLLSNTLQSTGNWGVVRVIPDDLSSSDLAVRGTILQSDGETMIVHITVRDSSGQLWIDKDYEEVVSRYSYDNRLQSSRDSFQGLYNRIANDILRYRQQNLAREDLLNIRTISQIQFARSFAPQAFDEYLSTNRNGILQVQRLPAQNDPMLSRIETIRERDYLYVDTMQDYYTNFVRQMEAPYTEFRRLSYDEVMKLDRLQRESRRNMILGIAAIVGGLAATQSNSSVAGLGTYAGILGGGWLIKESFRAGDEALLHIEALAELGQSLSNDVAPQTIELEERSVTLSGNVETQYEQWREILADMYANEIGTPTNSEDM